MGTSVDSICSNERLSSFKKLMLTHADHQHNNLIERLK